MIRLPEGVLSLTVSHTQQIAPRWQKRQRLTEGENEVHDGHQSRVHVACLEQLVAGGWVWVHQQPRQHLR